MNQQQTTIALQQKTTEWLSWDKAGKSGEINPDTIETLRNVLRYHEYRYYVQNDPLISDFEYDTLYKLLQEFEKKQPFLITADSPTQRVGPGLTNEFLKVEHLVPMLSLENSYNEADLLDWDRKAKELSGL